MNSLDVALRLRTLVRRCAPDADEVVAIRQVSGGASQEIWSFDATTPAGPVPLILRCARRWSVEAQAGCAGMGAEAAMLIAAREGGVPVPDVRYVLKPDDGLGEGFVMRRVPGERRTWGGSASTHGASATSTCPLAASVRAKNSSRGTSRQAATASTPSASSIGKSWAR
jgi:aminoglycoside phosphotransferase (APT) family kinase protein